MLTSSVSQNQPQIHQTLRQAERSGEILYVHNSCRRRLTDKRSRKSSESVPIKRLRSNCEIFDWKTCCFFCKKNCNKKHHRRDSVRHVEVLTMKEKILEQAVSRNDAWGNEVKEVLQDCLCLVAAEALYHKDCSLRFLTGKQKPAAPTTSTPQQSSKEDAFQRMCVWYEANCEETPTTFNKLHEKMSEFAASEGEVYCLKYFRDKFKHHFQDHLVITPGSGRNLELVGVKNLKDMVIRSLKRNVESKDTIFEAAARLLKEEIRDFQIQQDEYPAPSDIADADEGAKWVPQALTSFISKMIDSKTKVNAICQCIVQAVKPKTTFMPVPFAVGVSVDKCSGSKSLVTKLSRLGMSITPDEVKRFKQSSAKHSLATPRHVSPQCLMQFAGDNVDHDTITLDGKGTLHAMGMIAITSEPVIETPKIKRLTKTEAITVNGDIDIITYNSSFREAKENLTVLPIDTNSSQTAQSNLYFDTRYELLWHAGWFFSTEDNPRPHWSGFHQKATSLTIPAKSKSEVEFLPMIDMNPNDMTCVYSTMKFVIKKAQTSNCFPIITFDQPLYLKAIAIAEKEKLPIVVRMGGFHLLMSFVGSVGTLMKGSGLEELFQEIYASKSLEQILSGKNVYRAVRAHQIAQSALMTLILKSVRSQRGLSYDFLSPLFTKAVEGKLTEGDLDEIASSEEFKKLQQEIEDFKTGICNKRTAKLWLLYLDYINVMNQYIFAERTSNWPLHLQTVTKMLNLFAATGHSNYAKSTRMYLQQMNVLHESHPEVHKLFMEGKHTVSRTHNNFVAVWTDLAIEQLYMRSIKSRGGLTQGRGVTENMRTLWVASAHSCGEVHYAFSESTGTQPEVSTSHKELQQSRIKRDYQDTKKCVDWFDPRNPFLVEDQHLHSLSNGLVSVSGKDTVSCDKSEELGEVIQRSFDNLPFTKCSVKRNDGIKPISSLMDVKKSKKPRDAVDNKVLFTRFAAVANKFETLESVFKYELTSEPMSLFQHGYMRKTDKSSLRKVFMTEQQIVCMDVVKACQKTVVDGGALLHRVRWQKSNTFADIAASYVEHVQKHSNNATVVFDGYPDVSTKDEEHLKRNPVSLSSFVTISKDNEIPFTQDCYFSLKKNKAEFIKFLSSVFRESGIEVVNCSDDADFYVANTALQNARNGSVAVIADDTDIAVMLMYHWKEDLHDIYFVQQKTYQAWSVKESEHKLEDIKHHLLFIHSWSGSDTTSATFGKGKVSFVKLVRRSSILQEASKILTSPASTKSEVESASVKVFQVVYGGDSSKPLSTTR